MRGTGEGVRRRRQCRKGVKEERERRIGNTYFTAAV